MISNLLAHNVKISELESELDFETYHSGKNSYDSVISNIWELYITYFLEDVFLSSTYLLKDCFNHHPHPYFWNSSNYQSYKFFSIKHAPRSKLLETSFLLETKLCSTAETTNETKPNLGWRAKQRPYKLLCGNTHQWNWAQWPCFSHESPHPLALLFPRLPTSEPILITKSQTGFSENRVHSYITLYKTQNPKPRNQFRHMGLNLLWDQEPWPQDRQVREPWWLWPFWELLTMMLSPVGFFSLHVPMLKSYS